MGCSKSTMISNTQIQNYKKKCQDLLEFYNALSELKTSIKNLKDNNNSLNVYLISSKTIPEFFAFIIEKKKN